MSLFAVQYTYIDDAEAIAANRPDHRAFLGGLADAGVLVLSGPLASAEGRAEAALLVFEAESPAAVLAHLADDPFQQRGIVAAVEVRGWNPVLGAWLSRVRDEA